jgi:hypothetical protein
MKKRFTKAQSIKCILFLTFLLPISSANAQISRESTAENVMLIVNTDSSEIEYLSSRMLGRLNNNERELQFFIPFTSIHKMGERVDEFQQDDHLAYNPEYGILLSAFLPQNSNISNLRGSPMQMTGELLMKDIVLGAPVSFEGFIVNERSTLIYDLEMIVIENEPFEIWIPNMQIKKMILIINGGKMYNLTQD